MIVGPDDLKATCDHCSRRMREGEEFQGREMWHRHWWTCGHQRTYTCPECRKNKCYKPCPECGCGTEYC